MEGHFAKLFFGRIEREGKGMTEKIWVFDEEEGEYVLSREFIKEHIERYRELDEDRISE